MIAKSMLVRPKACAL